MKKGSCVLVSGIVFFLLSVNIVRAQNSLSAIKDAIKNYETYFNIITESSRNHSEREVEDKALRLEKMFVSERVFVHDFVDCEKNSNRTDCRARLYEFIPFLGSYYKKTRVSFDTRNLRWERLGNPIGSGKPNLQVNVIQRCFGYIDNKPIRDREYESSLIFYFIYDDETGEMQITEIRHNKSDSDFDTYNFDEDFCPKYAGSANGCPDNDGDNVPDINERYPQLIDACPDEEGAENEEDLRYHGCPDGDGDGVFDEYDKCPNEKGVRNTKNPECNGCPDSDGDFICDKDDFCPESRNVNGAYGCPDRDGDNVPDDNRRFPRNVDKCQSIKGFGEDYYRGTDCIGCPDSDGDLICDKNDWCPNISGEVASNGCPDSDADGVPDRNERYPNQVDRCPNSNFRESVVKSRNGKNASECYGCADTDKDGFCNSIDDCPNLPSRNNNGCPPPEPISRFELDLSSGVSIPLGALKSNDFYDQDFDNWNEVGFADLGWNIEGSVSCNLSYFFGLGVSAGYMGLSFNENALVSNLKIALIDNSISFEDVTVASDAYSFTYFTAKASMGYFRKDSPFTIKFEPSYGILQSSTSSNTSDVIIRYGGNAPLERFTLNYGSKSNSLSLFKGDLTFGYRLSPKLYFGLKGSYMTSTIELPIQETLESGNLPSFDIEELEVSILQANLLLSLYF